MDDFENDFFDDFENEFDDLLYNMQQVVLDKVEELVEELSVQWDFSGIYEKIKKEKEKAAVEALELLFELDSVRGAFIDSIPADEGARYAYGKFCFTSNGVKHRLTTWQAVNYVLGAK